MITTILLSIGCTLLLCVTHALAWIHGFNHGTKAGSEFVLGQWRLAVERAKRNMGLKDWEGDA